MVDTKNFIHFIVVAVVVITLKLGKKLTRARKKMFFNFRK